MVVDFELRSTENSRTALIELQADNPDGKLLARRLRRGSFSRSRPIRTRLRVPLTALVFGAARHAGRGRGRGQQGRVEAGDARPQSRQSRRDRVRPVAAPIG